MFVVRKRGINLHQPVDYKEIDADAEVEVLDTCDCVVEHYKVSELVSHEELKRLLYGLRTYDSINRYYVNLVRFSEVLYGKIKVNQIKPSGVEINDLPVIFSKRIERSLTLFDVQHKEMCHVMYNTDSYEFETYISWAWRVENLGYSITFNFVSLTNEHDFIETMIEFIIFADYSFKIRNVNCSGSVKCISSISKDYKLSKALEARLCLLER